jgi:hypothetical protein
VDKHLSWNRPEDIDLKFNYDDDCLLIGYWWEIQKERDHWEDQDVRGWTILKLILER